MEEALGLLCEVCILWRGCSLWYCEVRWGRVKLGPVLRFKNITHSHVVTGGPDTGDCSGLPIPMSVMTAQGFDHPNISKVHIVSIEDSTVRIRP